MKKIVFLHIPKTAGQTVHSELSRVIGAGLTSPVRVHTQAAQNRQFPDGYRLYSGHLDWSHLDQVKGDRFVFTVLRDPLERIASFYFYLHQKSLDLDAASLNDPANTGLLKVRTHSVDDYFFGGDSAWQRFILDHYDNFYCAYLATQKIRGAADLTHFSSAQVIDAALKGAGQLDRIYRLENLAALEQDISQLTSSNIFIAEKRINAGPKTQNTKRWPQLMSQIESDASRQRLADFAVKDSALIERLQAEGALS